MIHRCDAALGARQETGRDNQHDAECDLRDDEDAPKQQPIGGSLVQLQCRDDLGARRV